jgi:two-component system OmpR family response regulator
MTSVPHLLIVDDDDDILSLLTKFFRKHSHTVTVAADGAAMWAALEEHSIDLVILDLMLRGEDGLNLCRRLRATSHIPIIMLTAMADHTDRVVGLEVGADDYLTKPFDQRELLARVKAVLRRTAGNGNGAVASDETRPALCFADWRLDVTRRELRSADNTLVVLSGGEFDLLLAFAEHSQRVLTRDQLLDLSRGAAHAAYDRSIDVQVSRLRYKLEADPKNPSLIRTVRNGGYLFSPKVTRG